MRKIKFQLWIWNSLNCYIWTNIFTRKNFNLWLGYFKRFKSTFIFLNWLYIEKFTLDQRWNITNFFLAGGSKTTLTLLDIIQNRALKVIGDHIIRCLHSLEHRRNCSVTSVNVVYLNCGAVPLLVTRSLAILTIQTIMVFNIL